MNAKQIRRERSAKQAGMKQAAMKRAWRTWARTIALQPTPAQNVQLVAILERFLADTAGLIVTYRPMPGEVDLDPLADLVDSGRLVTTRTPEAGPLTVHPYESNTELHRYGFEQPVADSEVIDHADIEVALVPALLFARDGARLGHGRGYYDVLLATCRKEMTRVGVTTESRVVPKLPTGKHDITMTHLATELGMNNLSVNQ